jgi:regulator of sigma E protease
MQMGPVVDIRKDSPADRVTKARLSRGDVIRKVTLLPQNGTPEPLPDEALDPVRLPYELRRRVLARPGAGWRVQLTVTGGAAKNQDEKRELEPLEWDHSWDLVEEASLGPHSPVSIPELGIAYRVQNMVVEVRPGSPATQAGIKSRDLVEEVRLRKMGKKRTDVEWGNWFKLTADPEKASDSTGWANFIWGLGQQDFHEVQMGVRRGGERLSDMKLTAVPEEDWPQAERGLVLSADQRLQKADTLVQALGFGVERTVGFIQQIYLNLSSMLSGRVSAKSVGGPIEIASQAFTAAGEDFYLFLLFLGIISINLAVVNFLPIPVLDGGHMVFLVYEWVRGRPPSEAVRTVATYIGLALLLTLMVFVFYLDISRRFLSR